MESDGSMDLSQLKPAKIRAVTLFLTGMSAKEVAQELEVTSKTVRRWKEEEEFQLLIQAMTKFFLTRCIDQLAHYQFRFLGILQEIADDSESSNDDRIAASRTALNYLEEALHGVEEISVDLSAEAPMGMGTDEIRQGDPKVFQELNPSDVRQVLLEMGEDRDDREK